MLTRIAKAIRTVIPTGLRRHMHRVGVFLGEDPEDRSRAYSFPSIEASLQCLKDRGFAPKLAVDVGAFHGEWTVMFKTLFPDASVVMAEPQSGLRDRLN